MSDNFNNLILQRLEDLRKLQHNTVNRLKQLDKYRSVTLRSSMVEGHSYYYLKKKGSPDSERKYIGSESSLKVKEAKEYRFLQQLNSDIDSEIRLLNEVKERHRDLSNESINLRLPKAYRSENSKFVSEDEKLRKWKEDKESEKALYQIKKPEHLIMTALDGTRMRSKSEVIIANMLIASGIPFVYELPHSINGSLIYTDFTALSLKDYKTEILIEHEGLMTNIGYQGTLLAKINSYLTEDIIPGRDIFFTFDDLHGGFDPSPIQDIINTKLIKGKSLFD